MLFLIVDDDSDMRNVIKETLLDSLGSVSFLEAEDSHEAIGICQDYFDRLSFIICDYKMPEGNGDILFKYWSENLANLPYILYSSEVLTAREKFAEVGDVDFERLGFVEKSTGVVALVCEIEKLMNQGFVSIPTKFVSPTKPLRIPLHIGVNSRKIIKLCHEGDFLIQEKIDSYKEKGVVRLFASIKKANERNISFPLYPIHEVTSREESPADVFERFRIIHEDLLNPFVHKKRNLELSLDSLSRSVSTNLPSEKVFSQFKAANFFKKDYVVNHSLLVATLGIMGLKEMGLANENTRRVLIQAILIHDLFKSDSEAFHFDLCSNASRINGATEKIKQNNYLFYINEVLNKFELGLDISTIVESLILGLHDLSYTPRGNHRLSSLALAAHRISNDLYLSKFTKTFERDDLDHYSASDKQVFKALEKMIKV